jgi:hypothetical protein
MSWAHIFSTHEFWLGVPSGAVLAAVPALIGARSLRDSDGRKAAQEDKVQARKEERDDKLRRENEERDDKLRREKEQREDKLRKEEILYSAATEFSAVTSDILMNSVDIKGAFNTIRDKFYDRNGINDPNLENKVEHATKVTENTKRIGVPFNALRLVAPPNVLDAATQLNAAIMVVLQTTTETFAKPVAQTAAADKLNNFINVFREEVGQAEYTQSASNRAVDSFMKTLKKQVADYMEQAKADIKAAGFKTTPWDIPRDKSATKPRAADEPASVGPTPVRSLSVGEYISLPGTGSVGLISIIQSFNEARTRMTVFVQEPGKTVTLNVGPDQQFARVAAPNLG